ncbi:MAG: hypothetical protein IPG52_09175 [Rhodocyclaceae bacterium]|nr:hypothetical protein [Rhodocyclaceae bacterium]
MIRLRPVLAVLLSLLLVGAQQAAFAHMIGHIGTADIGVASLDPGDDRHGEALALSDVCTTCVGASGIASAVPFGVPPRLTFDGVVETPIAVTQLAVAVAVPLRYLARAPPAVL